MRIWLYSLISVVAVSGISLVGIFVFFLKEEKIKKISLFLVSFAVGGLFGDAFIHLLPEAFKKPGANFMVSLGVIIGVLAFFVLEKFLRWRHCHVPEGKEHHHPLVGMNLVGGTAHNFIDGLIIGASYLVALPIGISTTLAIIFHEIPQEFSHFGIFIHSGLAKKKALLFNVLSALAAVVGTLLSLFVGNRTGNFASFMLPVTAGGFLYIAGSDLIPELHHETRILTSLGQLISIMLGVGVMMLLLLLG